MSKTGLLLTKPLLQDPIPHSSNARVSMKALTFVLVLATGSGFMVLLSSVVRFSSKGVRDTEVRKAAINMAWERMQQVPARYSTQSARVHQLIQQPGLLQQASTWQFTQPARIWQFMKPARSWQSMQPLRISQSTKLARATVTYADQAGGDETGTIMRFNMERGYGFITPSSGGDNVFFSQEQFALGYR